jgi:hypothetical protein
VGGFVSLHPRNKRGRPSRLIDSDKCIASAHRQVTNQKDLGNGTWRNLASNDITSLRDMTTIWGGIGPSAGKRGCYWFQHDVGKRLKDAIEANNDICGEDRQD